MKDSKNVVVRIHATTNISVKFTKIFTNSTLPVNLLQLTIIHGLLVVPPRSHCGAGTN